MYALSIVHGADWLETGMQEGPISTRYDDECQIDLVSGRKCRY